MRISHKKKKYKFRSKYKIKSQLYFNPLNCLKIFPILLFIIIIFHKINKTEIENKSEIETKTEIEIKSEIKTKTKNKNSKYFGCFCGMGRKENLYVRELIEYHINIGFDKFIFADNNLPNTEKFSDVLQDYIENGTVDIIPIFGSSISQTKIYGIMYEKYKNECEWLSFFDFDEFLYLHENNKKLTLEEFVSNERYNKCESIVFNWLVYGDNDLVYYDNRKVLERFTKPDYKRGANIYVKCIVKGKLNITVFKDKLTNSHTPSEKLYICDSKGNKFIYNPFFLKPPQFDHGYVMHFSTKTAEEFVEKTKRGFPGNNPAGIENRINLFFRYNKFTEEKFRIFEKGFNKTFNSEDYKYIYGQL